MNDYYQDRLDAYARFRGSMDYIVRELERQQAAAQRLAEQAKEAQEQLTRELAATEVEA